MSEDNPEVEYEKEEGFVRLNLRRPVNLYVPTELQEVYDPTADSDEPSATLELDWVYGYRGRDCRNNFFALASGEIVYFTAAVAVIYNPETSTQRHFTHHSDDIKCLKVHPDGKTVATGQIRGRDDDLPYVCIWDSESLEVLHEVGRDTFNRGVSCVAFSSDGKLMAVVDDSPAPRLSTWEWEEEKMIFDAKAASDLVIGVTFSGESPPRIVTSGKGHLGFWVKEGDTLDKDNAIFGDHPKPKYVTSVITLPSGNVITGDTNGNILIWEQGENRVERALPKAHKGAIFYLHMDEDGTMLSSASDNKIVFYDTDLNPTGELVIPDTYGAGRVVQKIGDHYYIGTTFNGIIKANLDNEFEVVTQGHMDELWGLATNPHEPHFLVAGQDGRIFYRDANTNELLWRKELEMSCQSADISSCGTMIAVGADKGKWIILDNTSQEMMFEGSDGDEIIQVTRFSPDGMKLALGSRDNRIYIYDFNADEKKFDKSGQCSGHSSFVTHLDWSLDGEMLRTNSGDYEVLFWKTDDDCSRLTDSDDYKDVQWATNNCILSFENVGIWPPGVDGTHINSCNRAKEKPLMASGDDFGILKLFAYPATVQNAKHHSYKGHSSHITNVSFMCDDTLLFSTGGRDKTAMKWRVVE